jgi:phage terminase small subunit
MTKVLTPKQEHFCQLYIETGNGSQAYRMSYDVKRMKPATINRKAKELLDNGKITARLKLLQSATRHRHNITIDSLLLELESARIVAMEKNNPGAATAAILGKGKLLGLVQKPVDRVVSLGSFTGSLSEQGNKILQAMAIGQLTPSEASALLSALAAQARIVEFDELEQRIGKLEEKLTS